MKAWLIKLIRSVFATELNALREEVASAVFAVDRAHTSNLNLQEEVFMCRDQIMAFGKFFGLELVPDGKDSYAAVADKEHEEVRRSAESIALIDRYDRYVGEQAKKLAQAIIASDKTRARCEHIDKFRSKATIHGGGY